MEYKTTEAKRRCNQRYNDKFERVCCSFETGTKDQIGALGYSCNNFIRLAVMEKLEREERILGKSPTP